MTRLNAALVRISMIFTVDIGRLDGAVQAGVTQPAHSEMLEANVLAEFRDPDGQWVGLSNRARLTVASKDRMKEGDVASNEDLAKPEFEGKRCTRSGKHQYMAVLIASVIVELSLYINPGNTAEKP